MARTTSTTSPPPILQNQIYNYQDPINLLAAFLILALGILGVIVNGSIIRVFLKEKSERTSFNLICLARAYSNIIILMTMFLGDFFLTTIIGFSIFTPLQETCLIHLSSALYSANQVHLVLLANNRIWALFLPRWYRFVHGIIPTSIVLILIYLYQFAFLYVEMDWKASKSCYSLYDSEYLSWYSDYRYDCNRRWYNVEDLTLLALLTTFTANVISFVRCIVFYCSNNQSMDPEKKKRIQRNVELFFMTILQDLIFLVDWIMTKIWPGSSNRFFIFVYGTLFWEFLHFFDGFLMLMFNERLSLLRNCFQPPPTTTISVLTIPSVG